MIDDTQKQLGPDIQVDVAAAFAGKLWAYVAVTAEHGSALGVAVANEPGYCPVPSFHYCVADYSLADSEAQRLNRSRGISRDQEIEIVCSSMFGG